MGGGGLMQLVAYGAQDVYLTGSPQITFFKTVYRRHTNFAMESIPQTITGTPSPGETVKVTIKRSGDLLKQLWIVVNLQNIIFTTSDFVTMCSDLGHALFKSFEFKIGGSTMDIHYSKWLTIWRDLTEKNPYGSKGTTAINLTQDGAEPDVTLGNNFSTLYQRLSYTHYGGYVNPNTLTRNPLQKAPYEIYIPMCFWFSKNPGLALPLIALQRHEVELIISLNNILQIINTNSNFHVVNPNYVDNIKVFADMIFLDKQERANFAINHHRYLIEQVQYQNIKSPVLDINFKHPIKEIFVTGNPIGFPYTIINGGVGPATPTGIIQGNGVPLSVPMTNFNSVDLSISINSSLSKSLNMNLYFYSRYQLLKNHCGYGSTVIRDNILSIPFSLTPELFQPSGSCNFSKLDRTVISIVPSVNGNVVNYNTYSTDIYAINYNILNIVDGMGGPEFST
jgi:hypothetical protein